MTPFYALLAADALGGLAAAVLAAKGHLTITLRRRPEPRKPTAPGES